MIGLGALAMWVCMFLQRKEYPQTAIWKMTVLTVWLTIAGVAGTLILAFIETGKFGGTSFYGAIFMVPVMIAPAMMMKMSYKDILNLCAPAECAMLVIMRFDCLDKGCCFGRYLPKFGFQFPNQIAEMIVCAAIMVTLIRIHKKDQQVQLYPWYMILYGILRFMMNGLRYGGTDPQVLGLSFGHFWSLVSIAVGTAWLLISRALTKAEN